MLGRYTNATRSGFMTENNETVSFFTCSTRLSYSMYTCRLDSNQRQRVPETTKYLFLRIGHLPGACAQQSSPLRTYACYCRTCEDHLSVAGSIAVCDEDLVNGYSEDGRKDNKIVDLWHAVTILPLVYRLWVGESEDVLEVSYRDTCSHPEVLYVAPCCCEVDDGHSYHTDRSHVHCIFHPFRPYPGRKDLQSGISLLVSC